MHATRPWSGRVAAIWGKTAGDDTWLPLWRHLEDTAAVACLLWDHWLPIGIKNHIASTLPGGVDDARRLLAWLAGIHDIGKATPAFAVKAPMMTDRLLRAGFDLDVALSESRSAPHGALGYQVLDRWLDERCPAANSRARSSLAIVVGAHHGVMPDSAGLEAIKNRRHYLGGSAWAEARTEILENMAARTGAKSRLAEWLTRPLPPTAQAHLAAAVVVADWLASDETRFPYGARPADPTWTDLGLPPPWTPAAPPRDTTELLTRRFPFLAGHKATAIQVSAIEAAWAADRPPFILLEAEMGSGKTEAGLAAAEVLVHRFGLGGVFVALPTMATSDAMFGRVRSWVEQLPGHGSLSMYLAHGKAGLNDEFRGLADDHKITGLYEDDVAAHPASRAVATVNAWTRGRRKGVLAPFVVGTIDQVLFGALRSRHLALRHLGLASKVVVVDEVHAADTYMRQYLRSMLTWLGAYGTPVVLMSATLPPAQRHELVTAYANGAASCPLAAPRPPKRPELAPRPGYPSTLLLDSGTRDVATEQVSSRPRTIHVDERPDDLEHLVAMLREELSGGGCVAVIRNTVQRAQETWRTLQAELDDVEVVLVHSRFLAVDRAHRESDLVRRLGRSSTVDDGSRPSRLIVVGTQVLEQSLDIDVDLMISDLAPVDLLLQRVGRLHRHARGVDEAQRPARLRTPRLVLVGADWSATPVLADQGSRRVYGEAQLLASVAVLRAHGPKIRLAQDIPRLVDAAYDSDLVAPAGWENRWAKAVNDEEMRAENARDRAQTFLLERPQAYAGLLADSGFFIKGDPDDGNGGRSQVRDSEDSLEVVVVRRVDELICPMPGSTLPADTVLATDFPPEPRVARALAGCTVRLPAWSTAREMDAVIAALERTSFAGWQQDCPWLQGQLVLVLDEAGRARVAHLDITYDDQAGLTVTTHREDA